MKRTCLIAFTCLVVAAPSLAGEKDATKWLELAKNRENIGDQSDYAYTQKMTVDAVGEYVNIVMHHDPTRPGSDWELIEATDQDGNPVKDAEDVDDLNVNFSNTDYRDLVSSLTGEVEILEETGDRIQYRMRGIDKDGLNVDSIGSLSDEDLVARIDVVKDGDNSYVSRVRIGIEKSVGVPLIASFKEISLDFSYAPAPETNAILPTRFTVVVDGRVLLFMNVDVDLDMKFSDYVFHGDGETSL